MPPCELTHRAGAPAADRVNDGQGAHALADRHRYAPPSAPLHPPWPAVFTPAWPSVRSSVRLTVGRGGVKWREVGDGCAPTALFPTARSRSTAGGADVPRDVRAPAGRQEPAGPPRPVPRAARGWPGDHQGAGTLPVRMAGGRVPRGHRAVAAGAGDLQGRPGLHAGALRRRHRRGPRQAGPHHRAAAAARVRGADPRLRGDRRQQPGGDLGRRRLGELPRRPGGELRRAVAGGAARHSVTASHSATFSVSVRTSAYVTPAAAGYVTPGLLPLHGLLVPLPRRQPAASPSERAGTRGHVPRHHPTIEGPTQMSTTRDTTFPQPWPRPGHAGAGEGC
ncbi:protein of unknown function [Streptantibioticus cattleyicolor NRRL 8057 = DSM 46488]|nr:protein of unknown function [Streptantibioticus cattleyicolor NRRL 8057 = DSM 46488]